MIMLKASLSNDFMTTDVRATGLYSLSPVILGLFGTGMMVERLKQEGTSHSSSDLCEDGDQLVSTGFQTGWCHTVWAWYLSSLVISKDLAHIIFTDLEYMCGGDGGCWRC